MARQRMNRRRFLSWSAATVAAGWTAAGARADERPVVVNPRSTSGDRVHEPNWSERLTVTVGPQQADLVGSTEKVIQAAVNYVARLGGGTVKILPGTYRFRNAVYLASGVRIEGHGLESVLVKEPSISVKLAADSDWYDQEISLAQDSGFRIGDGVCLQARNPDTGAALVLKRTLVARDGRRFKLDRPLRENLWLAGEPTCSTLFPLLSGEEIENVTIENLACDGNRSENAHLDGNYAGCIWMQDCRRIDLRNLTTRNYHGDGLSWQVCHDVTVEQCHSHDNADLGLHPGSGSQRPLIRNNRLERNTIGIFWCWGVKFGLAEENRITDNRSFGISIGHNDTDNVMRNNEIVGSGQVGVLFRDDPRGQDFWPNRNLVEKNRIVNSGDANGIAIDIQGKTTDIQLVGNEILESRMPLQRVGIRLGAETRQITLSENRIDGFSASVQDLRASAG